MNSDFLCGTPLFGGIRKEEINGLLKCLNAFTKKYGGSNSLKFPLTIFVILILSLSPQQTSIS